MSAATVRLLLRRRLEGAQVLPAQPLTLTAPPRPFGSRPTSQQPLMSVPTPNLDHLSKQDYEVIYDPAGASPPWRRCLGCCRFRSPWADRLSPPTEDSFILLDALELDVEELQAGPAGRIVVEIG